MIVFTVVVAALIGAGIGAVCGLVAGLVLALRRTAVLHDRGKARRVAFLASAAPLCAYRALPAVAASNDQSFWWVSALYVLAALFAGAAGAFLSPWVVHGRTGRAPSLHE